MGERRAREGWLAAAVGVGLVLWVGTAAAAECKAPKLVVTKQTSWGSGPT